jgi:hypothetical protein
MATRSDAVGLPPGYRCSSKEYGVSSFRFTVTRMKFSALLLPLLTGIGVLSGQTAGRALPPPEEVPEERLRTEIILEARSPIDGTPLTPAEYEDLQAAIVDYPAPTLDPQIREVVFLLQIRRVLRPVIPFLP